MKAKAMVHCSLIEGTVMGHNVAYMQVYIPPMANSTLSIERSNQFF